MKLMMLGLGVMLLAAGEGQGASGDARQGETLYRRVGCYACHGYAAQGGVGPGLTPALPADAFQNYLRAPRGVMPPYAQIVLPDEAVSDIHAFLASLSPSAGARPAPAAKTPAQGRGAQSTGMQIFQARCQMCHGERGAGGMGPPLKAAAKDPVMFLDRVRKPTGAMPPFGPSVVSDGDIAAVRAYLLPAN